VDIFYQSTFLGYIEVEGEQYDIGHITIQTLATIFSSTYTKTKL
jgi:hypothetical protein